MALGSLFAGSLQAWDDVCRPSSSDFRLQGVQKHDVISMSSLNNLETVPLEDLVCRLWECVGNGRLQNVELLSCTRIWHALVTLWGMLHTWVCADWQLVLKRRVSTHKAPENVCTYFGEPLIQLNVRPVP